jgi:hypothetical protein
MTENLTYNLPCHNCIVLGLCKSIVNDKIEKFKLYEDVIRSASTLICLENNMSGSMYMDNYKKFLTKSSIKYIINHIQKRCSLIDSYIKKSEENLINVMRFFNLYFDE